jgi:hypothetical protein
MKFYLPPMYPDCKHRAWSNLARHRFWVEFFHGFLVRRRGRDINLKTAVG